MRHTSGTNSCPDEGEEMTGNDPNKTREVDRRAFRDDRLGEKVMNG